MNDRPTPLELIAIASDTLAREVLPDAKPEHLYALRMIANALGIAARELETQDKNVMSETQSLDTLYAETKPAGDLHMRNRQFARDIRNGRFENNSAQETELRQHLLATARAKLAAAYPKGLATSKK